MDYTLVAILTFFAVLIGGIIFWQLQGGASRGVPHMELQISPEEIVEAQLEEILESKNAAAPEGNSFHFAFAERMTYEELKQKSDADTEVAPDLKLKPLQAQMLKRCIGCLQSTMTFDARVKVVYESYQNLVPREVLGYLGHVKHELTSEIEAIKEEANGLKEGWGQSIFNQAMDLTVGLQRRKEARQQAEAQQALALQNAEKEKAAQARAIEEAKQKQLRDSEKAYAALMKESDKTASSKKSAESAAPPAASSSSAKKDKIASPSK